MNKSNKPPASGIPSSSPQETQHLDPRRLNYLKNVTCSSWPDPPDAHYSEGLARDSITHSAGNHTYFSLVFYGFLFICLFSFCFFFFFYSDFIFFSIPLSAYLFWIRSFSLLSLFFSLSFSLLFLLPYFFLLFSISGLSITSINHFIFNINSFFSF